MGYDGAVLPLRTRGGLHCETTTLGVLLQHAGWELSEPMRFGLGAGLSFVYWDSKRQPMPFLGGRVKPFVLTRQFAERIGLTLHVHETSSARKAWDSVRSAVDAGRPVGMQLDSFYLEYFTSRVHFAGHIVAMVGYDEHDVMLVDTEQQGGAVRTSRASLEAARAARGPMSAPHRSFTIEAPRGVEWESAVRAAIVPAVLACAQAHLNPPIANLGVRGILTAAKRVPGWLDRVDDPAADLATIAVLMETGGTGGGLFRALYRDFLAEAATVVNAHAAAALRAASDDFAESAALWTQTAALIEHGGAERSESALTEAGMLLTRIAAIETRAMESLLGVPA